MAKRKMVGQYSLPFDGARKTGVAWHYAGGLGTVAQYHSMAHAIAAAAAVPVVPIVPLAGELPATDADTLKFIAATLAGGVK